MIEILLTQNKVALIDDEDWDLVSQYTWCTYESTHGTWYACTGVWRKDDGTTYLLKMHRLIMDAKESERVDHRNGDGLDNRRSNLRICTNSQNLANAHKHKDGKNNFKGVSPLANGLGFMAKTCKDYKQYYLGSYATEIEAALAYDKGALYYHGEFARLNFPENLDD